MNISEQFEKRYMDSLSTYRYFYDDVHEYGSPETADHVFYFVPGFNGVPGQIRFTLPAFQRVFGPRFYIRCLYLSECSASLPVWEKYTPVNLEKRQRAIQDDLACLVASHGKVNVLVSSTGFYEFAAAFSFLPQHIRNKLTLMWAAAAPDRFEPTYWEAVFAPLNGIERKGHRWTALPNHNAFGVLNPEARYTFRWKHAGATQILYKGNLESRFLAFGISWSYFSLEYTNRMLHQWCECIAKPLDIETCILAGIRDGYWQGKSKEEMEQVIGRYLAGPTFLWKEASHLWIVTPENISELLQHGLNGADSKSESREQQPCLSYA